EDIGPPLPKEPALIAVRLALEGVPVAAIARALLFPSSDVRETLQFHLDLGSIVEMPASDWAPTARRADHLPAFLAAIPEAVQLNSIQRRMKFTRLEAGFMLVLLKREEADKDVLHYVIETQRALRRSRLSNSDPVDPKMVDVIICKMRKKLKPMDITISTLWGRGYWLPDESRKIVETILGIAKEEVDVEENHQTS
ncbi:MAG TPA: helix-turn-helix domain-containing protein, partial [Candidatus Saccharimonadia bacterium]|nr:helix-turn-helix domain-containing protein [Candidatus Saccharimonadia bacterium]